MRRASAISVLLALACSLIAPALFADPESTLPECCRRDGSHHCAMNSRGADESAGPEIQLQERCPSFPLAPAVQTGDSSASMGGSGALFAGLVSHPAIQPQTEARARVSFSRSRQKRGPPALLA